MVFQNKVWAGLSYRTQDAVALLVGMYFKSFKVGLSYDYTTSNIGSFSNGAWELMGGYCFKVVKPYKPTMHHTPRFL